MKVSFFIVFPEINASSRYRVYKYLSYLKKENIMYAVCPPMSNTLFQYLCQTRNPIKKLLFYIIFYLITYIGRIKDLTKVWEAITAAGRKRIEQFFDARKQGMHLAAIYQGVLDGNN